MVRPDVADPAEVVAREVQRLDGRGVHEAVAVERRDPVVAQVDVPVGKNVRFESAKITIKIPGQWTSTISE